MKKLFIPLLLILKIFKLKLLILLPLILGLASFKKILAFAAIIIPGIIGYLKFVKPIVDQYNQVPNDIYGGYSPHYSAQGVGSLSFSQSQQSASQFPQYSSQNYRPTPSFAAPYANYYRDNGQSSVPSNNVKFGDDLAYQEQYRSNNKDVS